MYKDFRHIAKHFTLKKIKFAFLTAINISYWLLFCTLHLVDILFSSYKTCFLILFHSNCISYLYISNKKMLSGIADTYFGFP